MDREEIDKEEIDKEEIDKAAIEQLVSQLDSFGDSQVSRLKVNFSESQPEGLVKKEYHHGRCDVGSPWARGCSFDVLD